METPGQQPYDICADLDTLAAGTAGPSRRSALLMRLALNSSDRAAVARAANLDGRDLAQFYPPATPPATPTTEDAIDAFLDRYGNTSPQEEALLERLIFNPVPDYSQVLAAQEEKEKQLLETPDRPTPPGQDTPATVQTMQPQATPATGPKPTATVQNPVPQPAAATENPAPPNTQDASLQLELARVFIKQRKYERAHEIISGICLNNPEKSVYFADQLRFLEKVIYLESLRGHSSPGTGRTNNQ